MGLLVYGTALMVSGWAEMQHVAEQYLIMAPLYGFPEAFINGMIITALVVYRQEWVMTFDYSRYVDGK